MEQCPKPIPAYCHAAEAALTGVATMALANRLMPGQGMVKDLTPSSVSGVPQAHASRPRACDGIDAEKLVF